MNAFLTHFIFAINVPYMVGGETGGFDVAELTQARPQVHQRKIWLRMICPRLIKEDVFVANGKAM